MLSKVVIVDHEPFLRRKKNHYFIDDFINDGIKVEFWSVCDCLPYMRGVVYHHKEEDEFVLYIKSYEDLLNKISQLDETKTLIVLELSFDKSIFNLFVTLKMKKLKVIQIDYYNNTIQATKVSNSKRIKRLLNLKKVFNYLKKQFFFIVSKWLGLNKIDLLFKIGNNASVAKKNERSLTYFDVYEFEGIKKKESIISGNKAVFIDIMLPNHPDSSREGFETINEMDYYKKLNSFFDLIEREMNLSIVIAAHPKGNYTNEFGNRECFYGETALLIRDASFILTHGSLSVTFALLAKKPIFYIYSDEFLFGDSFPNLLYNRMIKANLILKSALVNIDDFDISLFEDLKVDEELYSNYLDKYVYGIQYPKSNYEVVKEEILRLYER